VAEDLSALEAEELQRRVAEVRERMRPVEQDLSALRAERDLLLTEVRRRERNAQRVSRADVKTAMKEGRFPNIADLVAAVESGSFDEYVYHLKTGGEVRLGFPGARSQSLTLTDGVQIAQAKDFAEISRLYAAGWELGSPGRPGVRVHFPGTRQERLASAEDVFARSLPETGGSPPSSAAGLAEPDPGATPLPA
jgi:hypothetical protein